MTTAVVRDVTEQRKLESRVEGVQRLEAIGKLAGGVAHDFNNLLTVIVSFGTFALEALESESAPAADLREVLNAAERAKRLTQQLLSFSRRRAIKPQRVNLNETVDAIDRMLRRLLGKGIDYSTKLRDELWSTWVDPTAIEQVIVNLAVNARDAMPAGGRLTIETDNAVLDERYGRTRGADVPAGEYVLIAVTDNGHGMDAETQSRIFEPFFTTKPEGQGTGLGLSTSYGIVKQVGGYIWVYSEVGCGTTFKVYLPRALGDAERPHQSARDVSLEGTETVIVAEDDDQVRALTVRTLRSLGYFVFEARTAAEALALLDDHRGPLDLLLSDVIMPDLTGKDLAQRATAERPNLRVLYMSGYTGNGVAHHGVLDEGVRLLQKPFAPSQLASAVRQALDGE